MFGSGVEVHPLTLRPHDHDQLHGAVDSAEPVRRPGGEFQGVTGVEVGEGSSLLVDIDNARQSELNAQAAKYETEARDTKLGREVAVKVLPDAFLHDTERIARLEREARALAALNHPHIASLYETEQDGGWHFLVMELIVGIRLRDQISSGSPPLERTQVPGQR